MKKNLKVRFGKYKDKTLKWLSENDIEYFKKIRNYKFFKNYNEVEVRNYNKLLNKSIPRDELIKIKEESGLSKEFIEQGLITYYEDFNIDNVKSKLKDIGIKDYLIPEYLTTIKNIFSKNIDLEKTHLIEIHVNRYERMYNKISNSSPSGKNWLKKEKLKNISLLNIMQSKEKILGLHSKIFKVELNNYYNSKKLQSLPDIDFNKLNIEEKKELLRLYDICYKKNNDGIFIKKIDRFVEDVEIIEEEVIIEAPILNAKIEKKEESSVKSNLTSNLTLEEVKKQIQEKISEKLKNKIKKQ